MASLPEVQVPDKLLFLFEPARYKVAHGGRGGAKSWAFARALLAQGFAAPLRVLCAREIMNSIADSVHRLLADQVVAMGLQDFYDVQQTTIRGINGTEFLFAGLRQQDVHKIKSFEGIDRCWVEEAQAVSDRSWTILTPTIRKAGSEIWVSFNPELDTDPSYLRFVVNPPDGAIVARINWDDNPWFPAELEAERLELLKRDPDEYENVWEGMCRTVVAGAIYRREIEQMHIDRRFTQVPRDPALPVHTVWDLGFADSMFILMVQRTPASVRIIDCIEDTGRSLDSYVADLKAKNWVWGTDWLPHDGAAKDFKTAKSTEQFLRGMGRTVRVLPRDSVEEGIKAARLLFPRCYFDSTKAVRLVDCLKRYRRAVPQSTGEPGLPIHDEFSHGADAFRYLAMCVDRMTNADEKPAYVFGQPPSGAALY